MSCKIISNEELARTIPVSPPTVNRKMNPIIQYILGVHSIRVPWSVANHLKTLIPVGTAIIIVAEVK